MVAAAAAAVAAPASMCRTTRRSPPWATEQPQRSALKGLEFGLVEVWWC
jgi:hypothetical protein